MRLSTILWILFVAAITAPVTLAVSEARATEGRSADDLLAAMQAKITSAKTVSVTVKANVKDAMSLKADIRLAPDNKANLAIVTKKAGGNTVDTIRIVSDGVKQAILNPHETQEIIRPADPHLSDNLIASLTHTGFLVVTQLCSASQRQDAAKSPKVTDLFKVGELELGEKTTQGKRTVQAVNYKINADDPKSSMTGTVWIDLKTHLPQKRTVTLNGFTAEENYTNWKLDTPIEEATFSLTDKN